MNTKLNHVQNWLERAQKSNWSVCGLAKECGGISVRTLERYFLTQIGKTPKEWLNEQRQKQAVELLRMGFSIKQTASRLDYHHASTFSREFKKYWKRCPYYLNSNSVNLSSQQADVV